MTNVFGFSIGSIAWGLLIGIFCIALFFALIKGWWKDARFGCSSYIIGFVLGIILIYQSILACGSIAIIKAAGRCEPVLAEIVAKYTDNAQMVMTKEQSDNVLKDFLAENTIMAPFIDSNDLDECTASELPHAIVAKVKSNMRWFIFRRVLWSLVLTIVAAACVIKTMSRQFATNERSRQRVARTERTRISRRRR